MSLRDEHLSHPHKNPVQIGTGAQKHLVCTLILPLSQRMESDCFPLCLSEASRASGAGTTPVLSTVKVLREQSSDELLKDWLSQGVILVGSATDPIGNYSQFFNKRNKGNSFFKQ